MGKLLFCLQMAMIMLKMIIILIILLLISKIQNYTFLQQFYQQVPKRLSKGSETSVYWNGYKIKNDTRNTANDIRYFAESNFVGVNTLFTLIFLIEIMIKNELKDNQKLLSSL